MVSTVYTAYSHLLKEHLIEMESVFHLVCPIGMP